MIKRGRGMACMWYPIGFTVAANPSAATVKVNTDGTATVLTGTVETGQGALTVLGQIAAQALGIATDDVHVVSADIDTTIVFNYLHNTVVRKMVRIGLLFIDD